VAAADRLDLLYAPDFAVLSDSRYSSHFGAFDGNAADGIE
jgi:hypothetical protein